ncbi:WhiB family transcriptional regulator [Streptomyces sp. bgisy154]|uniref:WhiB family transcriptional regulator n=1 Tax=Streptomyces sp. bgisy154 TaxID=3413794 RepID=UPI003D75E02F
MNAYTGSVPDTRRASDWRDRGACRGADSDGWFPSPGDAVAVKDAKRVCFGCPVMAECARHALAHNIRDGVWGGLSEPQRDRIHRRHAVDCTDLDAVRRVVAKVLRPELNPIMSLRDLWDDRTYPLPGGHLGWRGNSGNFSFRGQVFTPKQLSFRLDRGRKAAGIVRRTCEVVECVHPLHVADGKERAARKRAAEALLAERGGAVAA